ncbi:MAG: regulatory protein RecX [Thermodesulfovibrionales bacterium]|nr:regulatory protein RecX [Thermodesulfovibrionales bacterium]
MSFSNLNKRDAIRYAYRLLTYRDRSEKELADKLKLKGFSEEIIQQTIRHLSEKGFINDAALALSLRRIAEDARLLGNRGVRIFLHRRGISGKLIRDIFTDDDPDEIIRAEKVVSRKLKTIENYSDEEIKKKIWRFLVRKGYSFDTINKILRQFKIKEE